MADAEPPGRLAVVDAVLGWPRAPRVARAAACLRRTQRLVVIEGIYGGAVVFKRWPAGATGPAAYGLGPGRIVGAVETNGIDTQSAGLRYVGERQAVLPLPVVPCAHA